MMMPAWAARHFIKILSIRAERLQEITDKNADAEGFYDSQDSVRSTVRFMDFWDSINKDYPFESNPWVFRYEFEYQPEGVG